MFTTGPYFIDSNSVELLCLYVDKYRGFSSQLIDLNTNYKCKLEGKKLFIQDNQFYNKIDAYTNIKLICGMNGTGKTTILELIQNPNKEDNVLLILKCNNIFISNKKIEIVYNDIEYMCNKPYAGDLRYKSVAPFPHNLNEGDLNVYRGLLYFYIENKKLFNDIDDQLITHFSIDIWDSWENYSMIEDDIARKLGLICSGFELKSMIENDLLSYMFYKTIGDSTFDDWIKGSKNELSEIINSDYSTLNKLINIRMLIIGKEQSRDLNCLISELNQLRINITQEKNVFNQW